MYIQYTFARTAKPSNNHHHHHGPPDLNPILALFFNTIVDPFTPLFDKPVFDNNQSRESNGTRSLSTGVSESETYLKVQREKIQIYGEKKQSNREFSLNSHLLTRRIL
ncbi:hypothetical protein HYC85_010114 [Camellia sinensis]|uniref:Uncharacterized protein n=1 Tax=Camellia sinensis TaxID=4442 RepID=A0A7J7HGZ0_CAMSI|nr:hypothetical protein HYC85_010114 [Camellia sinensis]